MQDGRWTQRKNPLFSADGETEGRYVIKFN
jgi:hypothetical protein